MMDKTVAILSEITKHLPGKHDQRTHAGKDVGEKDVGEIVYHGTSRDVYRKILKEGVLARFSGKNWKISDKGYVFVTPSFEEAKSWIRQGRGVVLKIRVPREKWPEFQNDLIIGDNGLVPSKKFKGNIPPDWIEKVLDADGKEIKSDVFGSEDKAIVIYLAVEDKYLEELPETDK